MVGSGARDELSRTLRSLRAAARLSQTEAAARAGLGQHAVSRFERGLYAPSGDEAVALAAAYGAPEDVRSRLRELAEDVGAETIPSRVTLSRGAANLQRRIGRYEQRSTVVREFHPSVVIGLLQTRAYMERLFSVRLSAPDANRAVAQRLARQRILEDPGRRFTLIQAEGALRWQFGSALLMAEQLEHMADVATAHRSVRVGLVPWTAQAPILAPHGFVLYDLAVGIVSTATATAILTEDYDLAVYEELFEEFERLAVFGEEAAALSRRIAGEYRELADRG